MQIKGNKGEWSELYVLLKLLATGKLYAATDANLTKKANFYLPVIKIFGRKYLNSTVEYDLHNPKEIKIFINNINKCTISASEFNEKSILLLNRIKEGHGSSFEIPEIKDFMQDIYCEHHSAPSKDKADIKMQLHDTVTGLAPYCSFSIKSELGSAPTLLNASGATNFIYRVDNISLDDSVQINKIAGNRKIIRKMHEISHCGKISFEELNNKQFSSNLQYIDLQMEKILAEMILISYNENINKSVELIKKIENNNPLNLADVSLYRYKYKKFLLAIALGMKPNTAWDGLEEATSGYIIVTHSGDVLAFYLYNRNDFEEYLLNSTSFDRASTSRHKYMDIYNENGNFLIKLNLQIRFH